MAKTMVKLLMIHTTQCPFCYYYKKIKTSSHTLKVIDHKLAKNETKLIFQIITLLCLIIYVSLMINLFKIYDKQLMLLSMPPSIQHPLHMEAKP